MKKTRVLQMALALTAAAALTGCSSSGSTSQDSSAAQANNASQDSSDTQAAAAEADWPTKNITILCPWSAGGGSDLTIRTLVPYLEEELGTSITVENRTGGGGWIAWNELLQADPDGYTIAQLNDPTLEIGYQDLNNDRADITLDSFTILCNEVTDWGCLCIKKGESRFSTVDEFIQYAKENELTAGDSGLGTQKHLLCETINNKLGTKITPLHQEGWSDTYSALLGGHIDAGWGSVGEAMTAYQDGEIDLLCVFADERSSLLPEVPTFAEAYTGSDKTEILSPSNRGFMGPAGMPEEIVARYEEAFEKCITDPDFIADLAALGQEANYMNAEEMRNQCLATEEQNKEFADAMGWDIP